MVITNRPGVLVLIAAQLFTLLTPSLASSSPSQISNAGRIGSAVSQELSPRKGQGYTNPLNDGGSMLTIVENTYPAGLGEPLNAILSADSDAEVLERSADNGGFLNYMLSTNLGEQCLGESLGDKQGANLGDGKGDVTQLQVLRWNFGDPYLGTCRETFDGGLHLRYWRQNTTGAYFMAVSVEMDLAHEHMIIQNGYNVGRDYMAGNLTSTQIDTLTLSDKSAVSGRSSYANYTYYTEVKYVSGLLKNSSQDINHYQSVAVNGLPAIDGLVAVLTVKIVDRPHSAARAVMRISALTVLLPSIAIASVMTLL